jgi:hypothetical protein
MSGLVVLDFNESRLQTRTRLPQQAKGGLIMIRAEPDKR